MANSRLSELTELTTADVQSGDLFLVTDVSILQSKKIQALSLKNYVLNNGSITGSITNATNAVTASYLLYTGIPNGTSSFSITSSHNLSSSYSSRGLWAEFSDTASYIKAENISGSVPSASYSLTSSYVLYQYGNGCVEVSKTASYCSNALTASYLWYVPGTTNGTASFSISSSYAANFLFDGTASFLKYTTGVPNGTASFALNILNPEITASYLILNSGRINGSASYAVTASRAISSITSLTSSFLSYTTNVNSGTASYSMKTYYCDYAGIANYSYACTGTASYANTSSQAFSSSFCSGTASYALTASYCKQTASYAIVAETVNDADMYRVWGPYSSKDSGGYNTTTNAYIQNFIIKSPTIAGTTIIVMALCDIKTPITTTDTDLATVTLYLYETEAGNEHTYSIDVSKPNNYIALAMTGAFTLSGYNRHPCSLGDHCGLVSGSWYRLSVETTNGALIDTTRGVTFLVYTKPNTTVTKTAYPPF